jgi:hypothetical protein
MQPGRSFELTGSGIAEVGAGQVPDAVVAGGAFLAQIRAQRVEQQPAPAHAARSAKTLRPGDVIGAAKARIREIKAALREHARLERELTELQRLVAAAKQKPRASIRAIDSARRAG